MCSFPWSHERMLPTDACPLPTVNNDSGDPGLGLVGDKRGREGRWLLKGFCLDTSAPLQPKSGRRHMRAAGNAEVCGSLAPGYDCVQRLGELARSLPALLPPSRGADGVRGRVNLLLRPPCDGRTTR